MWYVNKEILNPKADIQATKYVEKTVAWTFITNITY